MQEIDEYFKLQQVIYDNFGYKEDWRVFPLDDMRGVWWSIQGNTVWWSEKKENHQKLIDQEYDFDGIPDSDVYSGYIRGNWRLEPRNLEIYQDADKKSSMIIVDTQTDFNVFLMIFDNSKRLHQEDDDA
jgi:hypothetical protein